MTQNESYPSCTKLWVQNFRSINPGIYCKQFSRILQDYETYVKKSASIAYLENAVIDPYKSSFYPNMYPIGSNSILINFSKDFSEILRGNESIIKRNRQQWISWKNSYWLQNMAVLPRFGSKNFQKKQKLKYAML